MMIKKNKNRKIPYLEGLSLNIGLPRADQLTFRQRSNEGCTYLFTKFII